MEGIEIYVSDLLPELCEVSSDNEVERVRKVLRRLLELVESGQALVVDNPPIFFLRKCPIAITREYDLVEALSLVARSLEIIARVGGNPRYIMFTLAVVHRFAMSDPLAYIFVYPYVLAEENKEIADLVEKLKERAIPFNKLYKIKRKA